MNKTKRGKNGAKKQAREKKVVGKEDLSTF